MRDTEACGSVDLADSKDKISRSDLKAPPKIDPFEIRPIVSQKTKKTQGRPVGVPPDK